MARSSKASLGPVYHRVQYYLEKLLPLVLERGNRDARTSTRIKDIKVRKIVTGIERLVGIA